MNEIIVGEKIASGRRAKGLSQKELANKLCISKQAVGKWERDESMPDIVMLGQIAEVFGQGLNYFSALGGEVKAEGNREHKTARDMGKSVWKKANFSGLQNVSGKMDWSNIEKCKFVEANLAEVSFRGNNLVQNDFANANLSGGIFSGSNIKNNNFSGADFSNAKLKYCNFNKNTVTNAKFFQTEFNKCDINHTDFGGEITDCMFIYCAVNKTAFTDVTFKNFFIKGCNWKKATFSNCKADKITYEFLRAAKADLTNVTYRWHRSPTIISPTTII
jgi:uncharacterized protein YjbI with pentapeptide repeats